MSGSLMTELRRLVESLWSRLYGLLQASPPGTLQLTGVLGLAAVLVGYYQLRRGNGGDSSGGSSANNAASDRARSQHAAGPSTGAHAAATARKGSSPGNASNAAAAAGLTPVARAVRGALVGTRRITISASGVLLEQVGASELQDGASIHPGAAEVLSEVVSAADTYLITHVVDDVGQAVVSGALEAAGLVGTGPGQLRPHKLLFCSTLEGKTSIVRQLEPDLHIDGAARTVDDLKRFMPQLLHVCPVGESPAGGGAPNVGTAPSLAAYFGLAGKGST